VSYLYFIIMQHNNQQSSEKRDWSLWLGLAIPVLMMLFIALSIYVPRLFDDTPPPTTNFLYTSNYSAYGQYSMLENELTWNENKDSHKSGDQPKLFLYDVIKKQSKELTLQEAKALALDSKSMSPDGYKLERSYRNGFFLFDWRSDRHMYLINGKTTHKIDNLETNLNYYSFKFLAWVVE